jgi:flotillin
MQQIAQANFGLILIISLVVITLGAVIFFFSRYQKCPLDRILVIYGKTGVGRSSMCLHGGAAFVWPVIQGFGYLDLTPISIDIPLEGALTKER